MNLATLEKQRIDLQKQIAEEKDRHTQHLASLSNALTETKRLISVSADGLDLDVINRVEAFFEVRGSYAKAGEDRARALQAAIDDLANGAQKIKKCYFGTKDYAHWHGQFVDCNYGYGPSHGSVIFSIGLRRNEVGRQLTDEEIEDCLYYLRNLERIQAAAEKAAA
ncbi:TPA: hypothetical protein NH680_000796 [Pseudomonas aeruginosa]|nr:hypothetical protein [Pseudomonas aeruginosa]